MVAGTTSDAGKTIVTTALCRAFARRGITVAPFKAQNMSNNSMVCADGAEIGRAQWIQAVAAGVEPDAAMNPVLLKPGGDRHSHVVVMGQPGGSIDSKDFVGGRTRLRDAAYAAFDDLSSRHDLVVVEGAGSPAEINLRDGDYTNMGLAQHADLPVVVVGDIDRGGVFASLFGTVAILDTTTGSFIDTDTTIAGTTPLSAAGATVLAVSADGTRLYVADQTGSIAAFDTTTYTSTATINVGAQPQALAVAVVYRVVTFWLPAVASLLVLVRLRR